ncbi:CxxH/CxxC protein [Sporosarcina oncorhynchi]|uniref:CxxH/CxxC protein n=1 Tax=Sporosarcina oncorhynchi TaxID=3056444 RepID=A0ABZ0LAE4_9BACL|nr:CxxH/CxxC protein [Sporosarcina sp. T2O-4]WOV89282.1 CxxH/CxxC protein [Sporosarcina sp. T2O-4]
MKRYSCQSHIDQVIEEFITTEETFPILEKIDIDDKLSTTCEYCDTPASYVVANG